MKKTLAAMRGFGFVPHLLSVMCSALALLAIFVFAPAIASAAFAEEDPWGGVRCTTGSEAGECNQPRGVAASSESGHVFLGDSFNSRVVELDALGEFVRAWGWDVVVSGPGDDTTPPEDQFEICVRENGDECKEGSTGSGVGQFNLGMVGVALDSAGNVYVIDRNNRRVQKFSPSGEFLLMFGGEVNKTTNADVCTRDDLVGGDECGIGTTGSATGEFGEWVVGDFIDVDLSDNVYVGDVGRIQRFDTNGAYEAECSVPGSVQSLATDSAGSLYVKYNDLSNVRKLSFIAGGECDEGAHFEAPPVDSDTSRLITAIAVDAADHLFAFTEPATGNGFVPINRIFEFDQAGKVVDEFGKDDFGASTGLATNLCAGSEAPGNLYVTNFGNFGDFIRAYGTEPIGCFKARTLPATDIEETSATLNGTVNPGGVLSEECRFEYGLTTEYGNVINCAEDEATIGEGTEPVAVHADVTGLEAADVYHFRLRAKVGGETQTGPDEEFKTKGPPVISDEHVVAVTDTEAVLRARVNPEGLGTSCHVAYGIGEALDRRTTEVAVGEDRTEHTVSTTLAGLDPDTIYRWRFICENTAILDEGVAAGQVRTLATQRAFAADTDCPNQALRGSASAFLPDCRAYEMVSPVDKNGADIVTGPGAEGLDIGGFVQASPDGEKITYASKFPAFADAERSFYFNQYLSSRVEEKGWSTGGLHPPYPGEKIDGIAVGIIREFMAFTDDLCSAWMIDFQTPALFPDGQDEAANLYRRDNCEPGEGEFETLTDVPLPLVGEPRSHYVDQFSVQGHSEDGDHAIFRARAKLTADAAVGTNAQLYDRFGGALRLVSVLPTGKPDSTDTAVGSNWAGSLENAVSDDGSVVYWTSNISITGIGKIYARLNPEEGIIPGECQGANPCRSVAVSKGTTNPLFHDAFFFAAAPDGSRALYSEEKELKKDLYRFDLASGISELVVKNVVGVVGASEDLSRVYFVSREALADSGSNSEDDEAVAGQPNLYVAEGDAFTFIATLAEGDVGQLEPGTVALPYDLIARDTKLRASRVSPDGGALAFQSRAPIAEFDNTAAQGKPAVEVYRYAAGADQLHCVSCNPSGARPATRELSRPFVRSGLVRTDVMAAAWIPGWEHPTHEMPVLSEDGNRLFFNSNDALVSRDANGTQDVYEWEAPGEGGCEVGEPSYFPQNGGCLYLISSGQSTFESTLWGASADGEDVFFTTESSLLPQDPGLIDLYDARVDGGFLQPPDKPECEGEACQSPPPPPAFPTPSSGTYEGPGNQSALHDCGATARRASSLSRQASRAAEKGMHRKADRLTKKSRKLSRSAKRCRRANREAGR